MLSLSDFAQLKKWNTDTSYDMDEVNYIFFFAKLKKAVTDGQILKDLFIYLYEMSRLENFYSVGNDLIQMDSRAFFFPVTDGKDMNCIHGKEG